MTFRTKTWPLTIAIASLFVAGNAPAQSPPATRIRGEIVSVSGDTLVVHRTNADNVTIEFKPDVPVAALKSLRLADIRPGAYVGATSVPDRTASSSPARCTSSRRRCAGAATGIATGTSCPARR